MYPVYMVPAGDVLPVLFDTFDGGTGASITMSGLAVTDIEIYKDGSVTQRASDAGYTLLDTDGIDFDGLTGIHGFSIDTGDNTDASFYTVGAWFHVVVSAITVDAQTVSFIACAFRLMRAEIVAGAPAVDAQAISGDTGAADVLETELDGTAGSVPTRGILDQGTMQAGSTGTTAVLRAGASFADDLIIGATISIASGTGAGQSRVITDWVSATDTATVDTWTTTPDNTSVYKVYATAPGSTTLPVPSNAVQFAGQTITAAAGVTLPSSVASPTNITAGTITTVTNLTNAPTNGDLTAAMKASVNAEVDTAISDAALATAANLATVDTVVDAILVDTNELQTDLANGGRLDLLVDAIKAKTDSLTYTVANVLDANVQRVNDVAIVGDGSGTPFNV